MGLARPFRCSGTRGGGRSNDPQPGKSRFRRPDPPGSRLHSRMSTAVTAVAREGDRSEATGSLWARDTARRAPYRQPAGWRRDPSPLRRSAAASASLSTSSRSPAEDLLPRWEQAWCESRTSSARPAEHQNRRVYRLARCRKRQRVAVSSRTHQTWCRAFFRRRWSGWVSQDYQAFSARAETALGCFVV